MWGRPLGGTRALVFPKATSGPRGFTSTNNALHVKVRPLRESVNARRLHAGNPALAGSGGGQLLSRLRDADFTRVLLVTVPGATPVHEAARLQDDLQRAGIKPYAWIINQSFAGDGFRDPVLVERGSREAPYIAEVRDRLATRFAVIPWKPEAPVGPELLRELASDSLAFVGASRG